MDLCLDCCSTDKHAMCDVYLSATGIAASRNANHPDPPADSACQQVVLAGLMLLEKSGLARTA